MVAAFVMFELRMAIVNGADVVKGSDRGSSWSSDAEEVPEWTCTIMLDSWGAVTKRFGVELMG